MSKKNDPILEKAAQPETAVLNETDQPGRLAEKAVGPNGRIKIKIIEPGWGSSGYYSRQVLERDIPQVFPAGTHQYWNHPTETENIERPERDLNDLAAVLVTTPRWENGEEGPGMYAESLVFNHYAPTVDDIGGHIGVSILGNGKREPGEADGRDGLIVTEITNGNSIDFVTVPGAGGSIVQLFESAGGDKLPPLDELKEAHNMGEWLESRLHLRLTELADLLYGDGYVNREERKALSHALGQALTTYRQILLETAPELFTRSRWDQAENSNDLTSDLSGEGVTESIKENATMANETELQEATNRIATLEGENGALRDELALAEAQGIVSAALPDGLTNKVKERLQKTLLDSLPMTESGRLNKAVLQTKVEAAVAEAEAEAQEIVGESGQIADSGGDETLADSTPSFDAEGKLNESMNRLLGVQNG